MSQTVWRPEPIVSRGYGAQNKTWRGELKLRLGKVDDATRIRELVHSGPLLVQRPFYPEGPLTCHTYLLHPPGGLVGGDRLDVSVEVEDGAHGLITTPAAAKVYRVGTADRGQFQGSTIRVGEMAVVEWFPQESIVFSGANATLSTRFDIADTSTTCGWEILCLGRPACNETFVTGQVRQKLEFWCHDKPRYLERAEYEAGSSIMNGMWGLQGNAVVGTLFCYWPESGNGKAVLDRARESLDQSKEGKQFAVTLVNGLLLVRYLGNSTEEVRSRYIQLWQLLRPLFLDRPACMPRIWNT
jgi:urease accessory protein